MSTDAPFDPCRQWLGLEAVDLGDSRKVLGVPPRERDPQVVLRAAEARLSLLRAIAAGPYEPARAGLIRLVEEAREKLLSELGTAAPPPARVTSGGLAMPPPPSTLPPKPAQAPLAPPPAPPAPPPTPAAAAPIIAVPRPQVPPVPGAGTASAADASPGGGLEQIRIRTTVYRKQTPIAEIALTMLALIAAGGGLLYYRATTVARRELAERSREHREKPRNEQPAREPDVRKPPVPKPRRSTDPMSDDAVSTSPPPAERPRPSRRDGDEGRGMRPEPAMVPAPRPAPMPVEETPEKPKPVKPPPQAEAAPMEEKPAKDDAMAKGGPPAKPQDPGVDPVEEEFFALDKPLAEVLKALRLQEYDTVDRLLAKAEGSAKSPEAQSRINDWQHLATYVKGFYDYRDKALDSVKSGDEYDVKGKKIAILESDANRLVFRTTGERKEYARDKIPSGIILAIVMKWFDSNPANDLYLGSYHLAKPESDPRRARDHWEKARDGGADASRLLPLLDDPVFTKADSAEEQ